MIKNQAFKVFKWPTVIGTIIILLTIVMMMLSFLPSYAKRLPKGEGVKPPSFSHPLGTNRLGEGIFSQLVVSSKAYVLPGFVAVGIAMLGGVLLGSLSGYYSLEGQPKGAREKSRFVSGAWCDFPARYSFELINALPQLPLIFLICAITVTPNIYWIAATLGVMGAMKLGGLLRNEIISLRQEGYIEAAVELGLNDVTILRRHLLLTRLSPLLVAYVFYLFADIVLVETTLRFLEIGTISGIEESWGELLLSAKNLILNGVHLWWVWFFPALFIVANIIALYLLADAFRVKSQNTTRDSYEQTTISAPGSF